MEEKTFPFEIKKLTEEGTFEGYAAIFNKPDALNEVIEPGAFTKTLKEGNTRPMLWYHDPRNPIGIVELEVDKKGLKVFGTLNLEVQAAKEKHALMKQKVIKGLSFGFKTIVDAWEDTLRMLKEVKLYEVSPCTFQSHPKALIANVKQEKTEHNFKSLDETIKFLEGMKSGEEISPAELKLIDNAVEALAALLKAGEPSEDTQGEEKSIFSSVIEELETENKPQEHLFGSTIKTLENLKKE